MAVVAALFLLAALSIGPGASAQSDGFSLTVGGVAEGEEGDIIDVSTHEVDDSLVGSTCTVSGQTENNSSVHQGNELIFKTGSTTVSLPGIEEVPGQVVDGSADFVLGDTVVLELRFGPDGVTSGGVTLNVACQTPVTTTTTTTAETTTTAAPPAAKPTTPVGPADAGQGGMATGNGGSGTALLAVGLGVFTAGLAGIALFRRTHVSSQRTGSI